MTARLAAVAAIVGAVVMAAAPAARADFADGVAAYDRGEYEAAYEEWLPLARNDDAAAQRNVAHLFRGGLGVPQDFERAARWYRRAAEIGLSSAQVNLAVMLARGQGVSRDEGEAAYWFHAAAMQGHPVAQYNLGMMYLAGRGVDENDAIALGWLYRAARAGHRGALERLSVLVTHLPGPPLPGPQTEMASAGEDAPPPAFGTGPAAEEPVLEAADDMERADKQHQEPDLLQEASDHAVLAAGLVAYHTGNFAVARERWQPLAEAGMAEAQYRLGLLHGLEAYGGLDLAAAYKWLGLAAAQGHAQAAVELEAIGSRLSPAQVAQGRDMIEAWRAGRRGG